LVRAVANIERRVSKDGAVSFRAKVRLKGATPVSATFERKTDAARWSQQTEAAIREGRYFKNAEAKRHTLADLVDRYKREVLPTKPKSAVDQTRQLDWWAARIGHLVLADVTPAALSQCKTDLASGMQGDGRMTVTTKNPRTGKTTTKTVEPRSPSTVLRYMAVLSHAFSIATKEWQWLDDSPMRKVSKPKEPRGRVRYLSDDERDALLKACAASKSADLHVAVMLALSTGARLMELMSLRWPQVDLQRRVITLTETKNGEIRSVPLTGKALEMVAERAKVRRIDTDLLFPSKTDRHKPIDLHGPFSTALKNAGIKDFRWHDLRHTTASWLAMNGASLAEIAEALGHKTLAMVKRYAHLSNAHTIRVVESMNKKMLG
jgi:integrase